jgi:hypothetical protein
MPALLQQAGVVYPTSAEIQLVERNLIPDLSMADPIFKLFPVVEKTGWELIWDQQDNLTGLQLPRGIGGEPGRVSALGANQYRLVPGVYGEYMTVTEEEMITRARYGTFGIPIDVTEPVMERQKQLLNRRMNRIKWLAWTLASTGTYAVLGQNGVTMHTDTFVNQVFTSAISWDNAAASIPLADLSSLPLLGRGLSTSFGADAELWMNLQTFNVMKANANTSDLAGKRGPFGATFNTVEDYNKLFIGLGVPQIRIYEQGYVDDNNTFQLWIPYGKGIIFGRRENGAPLGNICLMANAANPNFAPGAYTRVFAEDKIPPVVEVHDGMNIAPVEWFPSSIIQCNLIH